MLIIIFCTTIIYAFTSTLENVIVFVKNIVPSCKLWLWYCEIKFGSPTSKFGKFTVGYFLKELVKNFLQEIDLESQLFISLLPSFSHIIASIFENAASPITVCKLSMHEFVIV